MFNLFIFWKQVDVDSLSMVARKTGYTSDSFNALFSQLIENNHDSIWIDLTDKSPYPLRKNGYEEITKVDSEDTKKDLQKLDQYINADK